MSGTNPFPMGPGATPNWVPGYVPLAQEWSSWWSRKLDADDPTLEGGPFMPLGGGTMTGELILAGPPVNALDAATKAYVDSITPAAGPFLPVSGGTMMGMLTLASDPVGNLDAATRQYVDGVGTTANQALTIANAALPKAGGTMTGSLILANNPTTPLGAATKQYVDQFLPLSGGTITSNLTVNGNLIGANVYAQYGLYIGAGSSYEWTFATDTNGSKFQTYRAGWFDSWDGQTGTRAWHSPNASMMSLDGSGNLAIIGMLSATYVAAYGNGIVFPVWTNHAYALNYDGTNITVFVDGTRWGDITSIGNLNSRLSNYLPLSGGTVTGALTVNGTVTMQGNTSVASTLGIGSYGAVGSHGWFYSQSGGAHGFSFWMSGASVVARIDSATDVVLATACDERLKQDIGPTSFDCLDVVRRVPLHQFRYQHFPPFDEARRQQPTPVGPDAPVVPVGFVAQSLSQVFPAAVVGGETESVDVTTVVAALVGAVQQLATRVDNLTSAAMKA